MGKYLSGQPLRKITTGLGRDGLAVPDSTLVGAMRQAGHLLVPLERAIASSNRASAQLHVDETTWKM